VLGNWRKLTYNFTLDDDYSSMVWPTPIFGDYSRSRMPPSDWSQEHITPVLRDLHWLPVWRRVHFKLALLVYKSLHGLAPTSVSRLSSACFIRHVSPSSSFSRLRRTFASSQELVLSLMFGVLLSPIHGFGTVHRLPCIILTLNWTVWIQTTDEDLHA